MHTRHAPRTRPAPIGFGDTEFAHDRCDADYSGFAPTVLMDDQRVSPATLAAARAANHVVEQVARRRLSPVQAMAPGAPVAPAAPATPTAPGLESTQALRPRVRAGRPAPVLPVETPEPWSPARLALTGAEQPVARRGWLARLERLLERVLPGHIATLLQLFICVSLSMALLAQMMPMIDPLRVG